MITLLLVALSIFINDGIGALLTIAEAKERPVLSGALDSLGDVAQLFATVVSAGEIVLNGFNAYALAIIAVMLVSSFAGTVLWTRVGERIGGKYMAAHPAKHHAAKHVHKVAKKAKAHKAHKPGAAHHKKAH